MQNDLLDNARRQAEQADPSSRAAALLRIARAESRGEISKARRTLLEGLELVQKAPNTVREHLLYEARDVAAAIDPGLLAEIPISKNSGRGQFAAVHIVQTMLDHGHVEAAFNYLLHEEDPAWFPFPVVGNVLHHLDPHNPDCAARRLTLLRRAMVLWERAHSAAHSGWRGNFVRVFGYCWRELPADEALSVARRIVARALEEPDTGASARYADGVHFSSRRQNSLFQILHVLRHLDPALAQSLIDSHDQLALSARRYPNGLETMNAEAEAEAERRKAEGPTCQGERGGYILDPKNFDSQRRLMDASRTGKFDPCIADAIEKYREDTAPATRNYAPREYWPSTGAFRTLFYHAGRRLGAEATNLLDQIPDDDLRLFATIELAAALAGVPAPRSIFSMKQAHPPASQEPRARMVAGTRLGDPGSPTMRSPDGRLIRCPKCLFQPLADHRWQCRCGHAWNTFWTAGNCPACHFQWEVTQCPQCGEMSEHRAWYESAG